MEIRYSEKEVKEIILAHAQKIFPEANKVSGESFGSLRGALVTFEEPQPDAAE